MTIALVQFAVAALVIIVAGAFLTRFADAIADLTGFGRLLVGSVLLAGATSLPELSVDINAVRLGTADLAIGDLVGSSLFNLMILALLDLSHRSRGQMLSRTAAAHALSGSACLSLTALVGISILLSHQWPNASLGRVGLGSIAVAGGYLFSIRMVFYDQRRAAQIVESKGEELAPAGTLTLPRAILGFAAAAVTIVVAGPFMAEAAGTIAEQTGLGTTFVGSTLVAFCTSLPELVATFTAVRIGAFDLAIGNIYGSNAFNMVLLLPLDLATPDSLLAIVSPTHAITCFCTVLITSIAVMGQLYQVERRTPVLEPDAWVVLALIFGSLGMVYALR